MSLYLLSIFGISGHVRWCFLFFLWAVVDLPLCLIPHPNPQRPSESETMGSTERKPTVTTVNNSEENLLDLQSTHQTSEKIERSWNTCGCDGTSSKQETLSCNCNGRNSETPLQELCERMESRTREPPTGKTFDCRGALLGLLEH